MRVAICGVGPAGLFAAWAARDHQVTLFDRDVSFKPGRIFALQYLHAHCDLPVAARKELQLTYRIEGWPDKDLLDLESQDMSRIGYNRKLGRPDGDVNSTRFAFDHPKTVFSLKTAYTWLFGRFQSDMVPAAFDEPGLWKLASNYDLVISTIPLNILFPSWLLEVSTMWITQDYAPIKLAENECVMNIDPSVPWTRTSRIDGGVATEYVKDVDQWRADLVRDLKLQPLLKVVKPNVYPDLPKNVILAGRWGRWDPKPLTHDVFYSISERLEA